MDNEGCGNCLQSPQGMAMNYQRVEKLAADYVKEKKVSTAIYQEGFEFFFAEYSTVAGKYPIRKVFSVDLSTAAL